MKRVATLAIVAVLAISAVAPAGAVGGASTATTSDNAQTEAYAGTHVSFETSGSAVSNYSVDGTQMFASAQAQSQSEYESSVSGSLTLAAVTNLSGAGLSLDSSSQTRAQVSSESGATINAHDSQQGILTVESNGEAQYVEFEMAGSSSASAESDSRVAVQSGDRSGAFIVAGGDGRVTVNDEGDVVADVGSNSTLVFRSYEGERSEADRQQEQLIAEGTATAQVYVEEQDGQRVADAATYGQEIAIETQSQAEGEVEMTVERASSEGTVVITSVSEGAIATAESADDVEVTIDGEAAAQASSYSELRGGIGNEPRYMVRQTSEASASADVLVAVDHFSSRQVAMSGAGGDGSGSGDGSSSNDGGSTDGSSSDDGGSGSGMPGFGPIAALIGLLSAAGLRLRN